VTELAGVREARRLGDYKRALELLRAPKGADAWGLRAALEAECGMLEKAERSRERLEKVLLADPGSGDGAARALDALGRHEAAYKLYLAAGSRGEQRAAELAAWLGIYARAEKLADGLPDGARAWTLRAAARAGRGRLGAALEAAEKAVALDPDDAQARVWRAELLRKLGRRAAASAELDRARALSRGFGESIGMFFNRMLLAAASGAAITMGDRERLGRLGVKGPILKAGEEKALEPATSRGIERALGAMKGNRSRTATRVVSGRL